LPSANVMNERQAADVKEETEAAMRADYSAKAAIISKYLTPGDATTQAALPYVFCKIVIEDRDISVFARLGLSMLFLREIARRVPWPGGT
jgi:hypothetical protein